MHGYGWSPLGGACGYSRLLRSPCCEKHTGTDRLQYILVSIKGDFIKVGFAAESNNLVENARQKLQQKDIDLIVANDITSSDSGFDADDNRVTIIDREDKTDNLPLLPKREVADKILDKVAILLATKSKQQL